MTATGLPILRVRTRLLLLSPSRDGRAGQAAEAEGSLPVFSCSLPRLFKISSAAPGRLREFRRRGAAVGEWCVPRNLWSLRYLSLREKRGKGGSRGRHLCP